MYIVRNKSGKLRIFANKPVRNNGVWLADGNSTYFRKKQKIISKYFNIILQLSDFDSLQWYDNPVEIFISRKQSSVIKIDSTIYIARDLIKMYPSNTTLIVYNAVPYRYSCSKCYCSDGPRWSCEKTIDISDEEIGLTISPDDFSDLTFENGYMELFVNIKKL